MSEGWHGVCPHCRHRLHVHGRHTEGAHITCPGCHTAFTIPAGGRGKKLAALAILGGCLLLGGLTLGLALWASSRRKEEPSSLRMAQAEPSSAAAPQTLDPPEEPIPPPPPPRTKTPELPPVDDAPPPLPAPSPVAEATAKPRPIKWLPPEEQAKVDQAIDRCVAWLRKHQREDGAWAARDRVAGGKTALVGLALLACGVQANDSCLIRAAAFLRRDYAILPAQPDPDDWHDFTYALSLGILFLDRLGDPQYESLIQSMTLRLLTGQTYPGCWGYYCRILTAEQERRLLAALEKTRPSSTENLLRREGKKESLPAWARTEKFMSIRPADHSNTQFAVMALWAAARHRLPVARALAHAAQHFRASQLPDGGWSYELPPRGRYSTFSMTAAGLYGLAVGHGLTLPEREQSLADPALSKGLKWLGQAIDEGFPAEDQGQLTVDYYCLWSVERTAVLYNLRTVDGRAWYSWGVKMLLAVQQPDGHWLEDGRGCGPWPNTAFVLLFLSRADVAPELSRQLRYVARTGELGLLVKTPDRSLQRFFEKKSSTPLEKDVSGAARREHPKAEENNKPIKQP